MKETAVNRFLKQIELVGRRCIIAVLNRKKSEPVTSFPLPLSDTPTILFLRQDRYGDAIISTPILSRIAKQYPKATLLILLGENNKDIAPILPVACTPLIYRKHLSEDLKMLRQLRKQKIDVLVDMTDNASATSSLITAIVRPRFAVGIDKENAESYNVRVKRLDRGTYHVSRRNAELLRPFGIDPDSISLRPELNVHVPKVSGRIALNISSREPSRYLPVRVNASIAQLLAHEDACQELWVFGQPSHAEDVNAIVALAAHQKVKAAPASRSFTDFVQAIGTCEYIISPDTAAVHIGSAFGIPMVVFFNVSPPSLHYWTPVEVPYEMIVKESMQSLTAIEVQTAFRALLQKVHRHEEVLV